MHRSIYIVLSIDISNFALASFNLVIFSLYSRALNVIDKMIKMLEQHAEHLEDLVAGRTAELNEEKKKVEVLLYSILPRWVHSWTVFTISSIADGDQNTAYEKLA